MSWDNKFIQFGVVKFENSIIKVYSDRYNYVTINTNSPISSVSWAGGELNVTLTDGKVRRYQDRFNYVII